MEKGTPLKLVDKFTYLGSSVESTEKDIETRLTKAWTAINRLSIIWKSDLSDKMKRSFFQAAVTSILLYGCTTWTLTKRLEKKLDGNYTRMLRAILNKSWQQHPTRHQLYGHLPPITKTIQVRRTRHAGHCWRSRDELIREVLLWIPTHGCAKAGRPARTYIQQLCEDTGCCPEDLPRAMNDREEWRERVRDICATSAIWWWLIVIRCRWFRAIFYTCSISMFAELISYIYIYIYIYRCVLWIPKNIGNKLLPLTITWEEQFWKESKKCSVSLQWNWFKNLYIATVLCYSPVTASFIFTYSSDGQVLQVAISPPTHIHVYIYIYIYMCVCMYFIGHFCSASVSIDFLHTLCI